MAVNKFKNAASKLLAQHSLRPEGKLVYEPPAGKLNVISASEPKPEQINVKPEQFNWRENNDFPVTKPILAKQNEPKKQEVIPGGLVTALIKYIIVLASALLGSAIAVFLGSATTLSFGGNIVLGLFVGTALGLTITKYLLESRK